MNTGQQKLYAQLLDIQLTPQGVLLSFEARLARENGWDLAQAIAVVNEYRKFLFLMLQAGHPVTPSDQVDQAWHLHLIYTDSYWNELCGRIAGRPLHHGPTAGGSSETEKYTDWYERTQESYFRFFGHQPPPEIWPAAKTRFTDDIHFQRVNLTRNMVVPRPLRLLRRLIANVGQTFSAKQESVSRSTNTTVPTSILGIAPLCLGQLNPLNFKGPDFLIFYSIAIFTGLVAATVLRIFLRDRETLDSVALEKTASQLSLEEIAFLNHGPKGPVDAAIAQLSHEGLLNADTTNKKLASQFGSKAKLPLLHQTILSAAGSGEGKSILDIRKACSSVVVSTARSLKDQDLVSSSASFMLARFSSTLVMFSVLVLGLSKIWVGLERNKPVGFLVLLTILVFILTCVMLYRRRLTAKGNQVLQHLKQKHPKPNSKRASKQSKKSATFSADVGMSVALFGVAAVGSQLLDSSIANILIHDKSKAWGDGGAYSAGCGGGDGGGGGCGGGGCGGCGGCGG